MEITCLSNYECLYTADFQLHGKSNSYISHLYYVQLYETLHLEMAASVIFLPVHPASFTHNFGSGMQSFFFSESKDAMVL